MPSVRAVRQAPRGRYPGFQGLRVRGVHVGACQGHLQDTKPEGDPQGWLPEVWETAHGLWKAKLYQRTVYVLRDEATHCF